MMSFTLLPSAPCVSKTKEKEKGRRERAAVATVRLFSHFIKFADAYNLTTSSINANCLRPDLD